MVSLTGSPNTYHMVVRGQALYAVVRSARVCSQEGAPIRAFMVNSKGCLHVPKQVSDASRFAIIGESFLDHGNPTAFQVHFRAKDWGDTKIWMEKEQLTEFFNRQYADFLWACTADSGWTQKMLLDLFKALDGSHLAGTFYKMNGLNKQQAQSVEASVNKHISWLEGRTAMTEKRENKRKRGECAGCPGSMMCWGGENLVGEDCVICGRMFIGISTADGAEKDIELLGEIKKACSEVAWRKGVCVDCKPGYRETVNEALYSLLQEYENSVE